jgi:NIMA (never in mitosis gene a)-related kinase
MAKPQKILPGMVLFGRYRVEVVGRGRATNVRLLRAVDQQSGEQVAIKIQPFDGGQHEAALLERLAHPHLVRFRAHHLVAGTSYLIEDWIGGERLSNLRGTCSREQVARIGSQLAAVLDHLHTQRIVHADLDGDNVLLGEDGAVIVVDLGLALEFGPEDSDLAFWVHGEIGKARELLADLLKRSLPAPTRRGLRTPSDHLETVFDLCEVLRSLAP